MRERGGGRGRQGEWIQVSRRGNKKQFDRQPQRSLSWDIFGRLDFQSRKEASSFFFTEIPDNFGARDMFRIFARYGDIKEVVIPAKRDKLGKRYGFARFLFVHNYRRFAMQLDNIIIGSRKIFVNIPRFNRSKEVPFKGVEARQEPKTWDEPFIGDDSRVVTNGVSYAEKVRGTSNKGSLPTFVVKEEKMKQMEGTHVGVVRCAGDSYSIQQELFREADIRCTTNDICQELTCLDGTLPECYKGICVCIRR